MSGPVKHLDQLFRTCNLMAVLQQEGKVRGCGDSAHKMDDCVEPPMNLIC